MATIEEVLKFEHRPTPEVAPDVTVAEAARLLDQFNVRALIVIEGRKAVGIFTERDMLRCLVEGQADALATPVGSVMSTTLLVCKPTTSISDARRIMALKVIHHLPVVDEGGQVIGLISLSDLNAHDFREETLENHYLKQFLYNRG